ncbi:hypothetical protein NEOLI_001035, partial [Neolecta irregularis DAH-3]
LLTAGTPETNNFLGAGYIDLKSVLRPLLPSLVKTRINMRTHIIILAQIASVIAAQASSSEVASVAVAPSAAASSQSSSSNTSSSGSGSDECVDRLQNAGLSAAGHACFDNGVTGSGCTSKFDTQCLCASSAYQSSVQNCILQQAPGDIPLAIAAKKSLCATPTPAPAACVAVAGAATTGSSNSSVASSGSGGSSSTGAGTPNLFPDGNPHACNAILGGCSGAGLNGVFMFKVVIGSAIAGYFTYILGA